MTAFRLSRPQAFWTATAVVAVRAALGHQGVSAATCCGLFWVWLILGVVRLMFPPLIGTVKGRLQVAKVIQPPVPLTENLVAGKQRDGAVAVFYNPRRLEPQIEPRNTLGR